MMSPTPVKTFFTLPSQLLGPVAVAVAIAAAGTWGLLKPQWQRYQEVRVARVQVEGAVAQLQGYADRLDDVQAEYSAARRDSVTQLSRLGKIVPVTMSNAELFAEFQQVIEGSGLVLVGMRIAPEPKAKDPRAVAVSFTVRGGNYPALKRLLAILERNLRLTDVVSLSFDTQVQTYTVTARLYSMR